MDPLLTALISSIIGLWLGSIEWRLKAMDNSLRDVPSRREVSEEIKVRQESIQVLQQEIKEDIRLMREQLERLISR